MSIINECSILVDDTRKCCPLVHNITNYVTVNDVANIELAMGASPIMADDENEVSDIASISKALVINIGTLNSKTVNAMLIAGKTANEKGVPVVLDPVGAGASKFRNETVIKILDNVDCAVIRGNLSEMSFIAGLEVSTKGVDSSDNDKKNDKHFVAKKVAEKYNCVAGVTGAVDVVCDKSRIVEISNGNAMLSNVTGTGCMTSGLTGGYIGDTEDYFTATVTAISAMGIAGEISFEKYGEVGTSSFHCGIIDAISKLDGKTFAERAKINEL